MADNRWRGYSKATEIERKTGADSDICPKHLLLCFFNLFGFFRNCHLVNIEQQVFAYKVMLAAATRIPVIQLEEVA
jgi:hypothetical protein